MSDDELVERVRELIYDADPEIPAAAVVALCREAIAAEIDAVTIEAPLSGDPMPGCPGCGPYSDHCCGQSADYERALRERIAAEIEAATPRECDYNDLRSVVERGTFRRCARLVRGEQQ